MRYASLSKPIITRIIIMLSVIFMQNLYEKFYNKKKPVILISNKTLDSSIKQYAIRQNLEHFIFERFESIRSLSESMSKLHFSISSKSIAQELTIQQRHIKAIKHGALSKICINDVRRHIMSPVNLAVAVKTSAQHRICGISRRKTHQIIRCSNKV